MSKIWRSGDIVRVDKGFAEDEKMRWACREEGQKQDPAVLQCKEKWSGEHTEQDQGGGQKEKEQMILKLRKDKHVLSKVKTSTEIKKKNNNCVEQ